MAPRPSMTLVYAGGRIYIHNVVRHIRIIYRVAQNHGKQVLRISHTILSFLDEIASASQQLPFFTRSAQLPLLSKVSCSDLFAHEE